MGTDETGEKSRRITASTKTAGRNEEAES